MKPGLRLRGEIFLWRRGWIWPLAVALWLGAFALDHRARQADERIASLEASLRALPIARSSPAATLPVHRPDALPTEALAAPDVPASVARMLALAQSAGIELAQAEYQHAAHPTLQLVQTQVVQPVRASYPQLRRYLESVLRELPHASLDHVSARRDNVAQGQLDVRLQWSLWGAAPLALPTANGKSP